MKPNTEPALATAHTREKPRLALAIATSLGVGYIPKAPGTFGSLVGVALTWLLRPHHALFLSPFLHPTGLFGVGRFEFGRSVVLSLFAMIMVAGVGVWASSKAARYDGRDDPQYVVIDEVSGQMLTLLSAGWLFTFTSDDLIDASRLAVLGPLNWKCLLLGFILFRVFDIWKPFPIRRLEKLPGGWGIMADDWMAGIYAAILLRLALHFSLL